MIKVDNLKKSFEDFAAVDGITFSVGSGEVLGFLGPNGAGKSTTMKMITGFIRPTSGRVTVFGHDVEQESVKAKTMMGYLPEGAPAYGDMSVREFLSFVASIRGYSSSLEKTRVGWVVEQLELQSVYDRSIDALSKGFKRRVGIAQAMMHDPKVLILDEPTDGLDPNQKHHVRELISGLARDKIVIVSTHILEEVTAVCTRAIIIANGRVVADATPAALESRSRYYRAVTISMDEIENSIVEDLSAIDGVKAVEEHTGSSGRYTILPKDGADLFGSVKQLITDKNWQVKELYVESGRLDDVFRTLTSESERRGVA